MTYRDVDWDKTKQIARRNKPESKVEQPQHQTAPARLWAGGRGSVGNPGDGLNKNSGGQLSRAGNSLLQLQNQYGNQYVQRLINPHQQITVQPKLMLGDINTPSEREADRIASQVSGNRTATSSPTPVTGTVTPVSPQIESSINQARGGGQPLPEQTRSQMEQSMGTDLSGVRVHTNGRADSLNQTLQAKAFTTGSDLFFRRGVYKPGSSDGQELIAHELTHTLQQTQSVSPLAEGQIQREMGVDGTPDFQVNENHPLPDKLGTIAAAQGDQIYLSPIFDNFPLGFRQEVMHHEIGHIKQQRQTPILATTTVNGFPVNQDPHLERQASSHNTIPPGQFTGDLSEQAFQTFANIPAWALRFLVSEGVKYGVEKVITNYEELLKHTVDEKLKETLGQILFKLYWAHFGYASAKMLMPKVVIYIDEARKKYGYTLDGIIQEYAPTLAAWIPDYDLSELREILSEIPVNLAANYLQHFIGNMGVSAIEKVGLILQDPKLEFLKENAKWLDVGYMFLTIKKPKLKVKKPFQKLAKGVKEVEDKLESQKDIIQRFDPKKQLYAELTVELVPAFYTAIREAYQKSDGKKSWEELFEIASLKFLSAYGDGALKAVTRYAVGQGLDYLGVGTWMKAIVQPIVTTGIKPIGKYLYYGANYAYKSASSYMSSWWYGQPEVEEMPVAPDELLQHDPFVPSPSELKKLIEFPDLEKDQPINVNNNYINQLLAKEEVPKAPPFEPSPKAKREMHQWKRAQEAKESQNELFLFEKALKIKDVKGDIELEPILTQSGLVEPKRKKVLQPQKTVELEQKEVPQGQAILSSNVVASAPSLAPQMQPQLAAEVSYRQRAHVTIKKIDLYVKPEGKMLYQIPKGKLIYVTRKTRKSKNKAWVEVQHYSTDHKELKTGWVISKLIRQINTFATHMS